MNCPECGQRLVDWDDYVEHVQAHEAVDGRVNHNARVLKLLNERGYIAAVVEKYDSFSGRTHDLFGFLDVLAVGGGETLGVQVTSRSNMAARRRKIREAPELSELLLAGWSIELWGYDQPNGPRTAWRLLTEDIDQ